MSGLGSCFLWCQEGQAAAGEAPGEAPAAGGLRAAGAMVCVLLPFHLLLLLRLVGTWEAGLAMVRIWVLPRPLGLTLVGASGCSQGPGLWAVAGPGPLVLPRGRV